MPSNDSPLVESVDITTTVGEIEEFLTGVSISYGVNRLGSATVSLQLPTDEVTSVYSDLSAPRFDVTRFIGEDIEIRWANKDLLLFRGVVTGSSWNKTEQSVEYQLKCSSGPLAMMNTTIGSNGIAAWCDFCHAEIGRRLEDTLVQGEWSSPKTLLIEMATAVKSFTQQVDLGKMPDDLESALDIIDAALDDVISDLADMFEPQILQTFWGYAGLISESRSSLAEKMAANAKSSVGMSWLNFFQTYLNQLDINWVPTQHGTLLLPNMAFMPAICQNVAFPSMLRSSNIDADTFSSPAILLMGFDGTSLTSDVDELNDLILNGQYVAYPKDRLSSSLIVPRYAADTFRIINPPPGSEFWYTAFFDKELYDRFVGQSYANTELNREVPTEEYRSAINKWREFAENWLRWYYFVYRYQKNGGNAVITFNPAATPGFPGLVVDSISGNVYSGRIDNVTHTLTPVSASTVLELSHVIPDFTQQEEVDNNVTNNMFVALKDSVAEVFTEVTGKASDPIKATEIAQFERAFNDINEATAITRRLE